MKLCKVCDLPDWEEESFLSVLDEIGLSIGRHCQVRKHWEYAKAIQVLRGLGFLRAEATGLSVGAGREHTSYYLANAVHCLHAVDIYGSGPFAPEVAPADMLIHPERFAPFPYRREGLITQYMDGRNLRYPGDSFDFAISLSSIEHFGGHTGATAAMREIARVVRPGGVVVLTTEVILNQQSHPEYFTPQELNSVLIEPSGLQLAQEIDFTICASLLAAPIDLRSDYRQISPHIVCEVDGVVFTSVLITLEKAGVS